MVTGDGGANAARTRGAPMTQKKHRSLTSPRGSASRGFGSKASDRFRLRGFLKPTFCFSRQLLFSQATFFSSAHFLFPQARKPKHFFLLDGKSDSIPDARTLSRRVPRTLRPPRGSQGGLSAGWASFKQLKNGISRREKGYPHGAGGQSLWPRGALLCPRRSTARRRLLEALLRFRS